MITKIPISDEVAGECPDEGRRLWGEVIKEIRKIKKSTDHDYEGLNNLQKQIIQNEYFDGIWAEIMPRDANGYHDLIVVKNGSKKFRIPKKIFIEIVNRIPESKNKNTLVKVKAAINQNLLEDFINNCAKEDLRNGKYEIEKTPPGICPNCGCKTELELKCKGVCRFCGSCPSHTTEDGYCPLCGASEEDINFNQSLPKSFSVSIEEAEKDNREKQEVIGGLTQADCVKNILSNETCIDCKTGCSAAKADRCIYSSAHGYPDNLVWGYIKEIGWGWLEF